MSTQGLVGVVVDGELFATVNVFDSYPSRFGRDLLRWAALVEDWDTVRDQARAIRRRAQDDKISENDAKVLNANIERFSNRVTTDMTYSTVLSNLTFPEHLPVGLIIDGESFAQDSLNCEWGYIFDLDEERMEVYMGYQTEEHESGRFWEKGPTSLHGETFYPIKLVSAFYLDGLPDTSIFVDTVESKAIRERKAIEDKLASAL